MLSIRLARYGKKKMPFYRIVVAEKSRPRQGSGVDIIGHFDPIKDIISIDHDKVNKWIKNGAKCTKTVGQLIKKSKKS